MRPERSVRSTQCVRLRSPLWGTLTAKENTVDAQQLVSLSKLGPRQPQRVHQATHNQVTCMLQCQAADKLSYECMSQGCCLCGETVVEQPLNASDTHRGVG